MITYHLDYRSPFTCFGIITHENGDKILIKANAYDEQKEIKEGINTKIIVLNHSFDDFDNMLKEMIEVLKTHNVSHVYDPEMWGAPDWTTDKNCYMHIRDYIDFMLYLS